jgi:hypothetical protein
MGILFDGEHWSRAVNGMWELRRPRESVMPIGNIVAFLEIACKTLEDLIYDKDFDSDLALAAKLAAAAPGVPPTGTEQFDRFLDRFIGAERTLFIQSKMDEHVAANLLSEIRQTVEFLNKTHVDIRGLAQGLKRVTELTCSASKREADAVEADRRGRNTWKAIKGCAIIGIDGGSTVAAGLIHPILAGLVGAGPALVSIKVGGAMVSDVLKDII